MNDSRLITLQFYHATKRKEEKSWKFDIELTLQPKFLGFSKWFVEAFRLKTNIAQTDPQNKILQRPLQHQLLEPSR